MIASAPQLTGQHQSWLEEFERQRGRPPRVLHIGNIANNAYLNAKILNRAGIPSDVLCYDYYHIMGCPEWEDADFEGTIEDQFRPDWDHVDLRGFQRPRWFAQGPLPTAAAYLKAYRQGDKDLAERMWQTMRETPAPAQPLTRITSRVWRKMRRVPQKILSLCLGHREDRLLAHRRKQLCADFRAAFPDRSDHLVNKEFNGFAGMAHGLRELFAQYDLIVAYSTDGILPLLADTTPYFAFEHGTIRNIPFEKTVQGRLCALTYRMARGVFVTNCDNNKSAERLGVENYRFIPHPLNEDLGNQQGAAELRRQLRGKLHANFLAFHPPRQHWETARHPDWDKGNDIFLRGFARFVKEVNPQAAAVLVDWGKTVAASKSLLAELGVADRVLWIDPVPNQAMCRYIRACDVLADQFTLGVFGGTMPKALMLGVPAMLYLDEEKHRWCFDEMPPILNGKDADMVFSGLAALYRQPKVAEELGRAGQAWYRKYHSNQVVLDRLAETFQQAIVLGEGIASHAA